MKRLPLSLVASLVFALLASCVPITAPPTGQALPATGTQISGRVLWGSSPVAAAKVELRTGAWATAATEVIATTRADANGNFVLAHPPVGEFGLVALWPDGGANMAPVTPVQISAGAVITGMVVSLAREMALIEPRAGATVSVTPTLRWQPFPGTDHYRIWVIDAGTTELLVDQTLSATQLTVNHPLKANSTYTWLVQAFAEDGSFLAELENAFSTE